MYAGATTGDGVVSVVENSLRRCTVLTESLQILTESKLSSSSKATLSRLINSEASFLRRLSAGQISTEYSLSLNIGHLEAVVHLLLQPFVSGASRVCRPVRLSSSESIYVDIVCSLNGEPVWLIVSDRNPRYITWGSDEKKGLKQKVLQLVDAANRSSVMLRPSWILLFFSQGIRDDICQKLQSEFGALDFEMDPFVCQEVEIEDKWTNLVLGRFFPDACVFKVKVNHDCQGMKEPQTDTEPAMLDYPLSCKECYVYPDLDLGSSFCSLLSAFKCWCCCSLDNTVEHGVGLLNLVNFDTTAMIAIVSGISNNGGEKLLSTPEKDLRARFKGNYEFVIGQANSEIQNPIHGVLSGFVSGKQGIICESVCSEFKGLISMFGGPNEKLRAEYILNRIKVVADFPSTRFTSLPTTRKLTVKHKIIFGTGDHYLAPTVTANMSFVRAVRQEGVSVSFADHNPRALIGV